MVTGLYGGMPLIGASITQALGVEPVQTPLLSSAFWSSSDIFSGRSSAPTSATISLKVEKPEQTRRSDCISFGTWNQRTLLQVEFKDYEQRTLEKYELATIK